MGSTAHTYTNMANSRTAVRVNHSGQRGIYVWTNLLNGNQYVGSSNNLGIRLSSYFNISYLIRQKGRGSLIALALVKHGLAAFSLQVLPMGPGLVKTTPSNERDYLSLEQYYLDMYSCVYNSYRRVSPASHSPSVVIEVPQTRHTVLLVIKPLPGTNNIAIKIA